MTLPKRSPSLRKSVLVVDDDEGARAAIYYALSCQYRVTLAVDGTDGYVKANEPPGPDLIIAAAMAHLDVITMARRIRDNDLLCKIPIIFLTGPTSPASLVERLPAVHPFAYLPRPMRPYVLKERVESALGGA
jgi:DNA-binding response OmpR family regulator